MGAAWASRDLAAQGPEDHELPHMCAHGGKTHSDLHALTSLTAHVMRQLVKLRWHACNNVQD